MNKDLRAANVAKDEAERLLSNLEKLKAEGSIQETEYETLNADYCKMRDDAISKINSIEVQLQEDLVAKTDELQTCKQELANLEARFKVGEIPSNLYKRQEKVLKKKIAGLQKDETAVKENWFKRHLNWTLVLSAPCGYFITLIISYIIWLGFIGPVFYAWINRATMGPFLDVAFYGSFYTIWYLTAIPITIWYLRRKAQRWHYVFLLTITPILALFLLLALHNLSEATPNSTDGCRSYTS